MFQSSLAPKGESYPQFRHKDDSTNRFNPLSPRRARATFKVLRKYNMLLMFQSSLAPKGESYLDLDWHEQHIVGFNPLSPRRARATIRRT